MRAAGGRDRGAPGDGVGVPRRPRQGRCAGWGSAAELDPRPGGELRVDVIPGSIASGEFVEVDPPRRLVYTWGWEEGGGGPSSFRRARAPSRSSSSRRRRDARCGSSHRDLPNEESAERHGAGLGPLPGPARGRPPAAATRARSLARPFATTTTESEEETRDGQVRVRLQGRRRWPQTEEEQAKAMAAWTAWFGELGDASSTSAIRSAPRPPSAGGSNGVGLRASPATRSSRPASLDDAAAKARGCPILAERRQRRGLRGARDVAAVGGPAGAAGPPTPRAASAARRRSRPRSPCPAR